MKLSNNARRYLAYTTLMVVGFNTSCTQDTPQEEPASSGKTGDLITVPEHSPLKAKLKETLVDTEIYKLQISAAGMVKAIPTQYAEVAPPFQGRVIKSYLKLGMKTTPQTPLFEISSPDFITAQKTFFQEKLQMQQAEKTLKRQNDLLNNGVGTQKDLEEAQTAYNIAQKEFENAVIGIKNFKADPASLTLGQALVVYAPIHGEVIQNNVVLGQFIKDDASSQATIADLSKVWIVGQVKEKDIRNIHKNDECEIEVAALPGTRIKAKVYHIEELVNQDTRSVQVFITCNNPNLSLKPGMYASVNFMDTPGPVLMVPLKSVLQMNGTNFVFMVRPDGKYEKRAVETGNTLKDRIIIKSGLHQGEKIISQGAFYLLEAK